MSIQIAILKILASHGSGRATLSSLNRDIAILTSSGGEWNARIRRLAARVPAIDIFGDGYVMRGDEGWEITAGGRDFLAMLEAVTQDNLPQETEPEPDGAGAAEPLTRGDLIVVGHRFRNRVHRPGTPLRRARGIAGSAGIRHGENASS
ncbi:aminoacyl-tRNA deacylase [Bradyrhizobium sp.]|uniref:aminoacyl-tRNA deacylase n=1 Tax=Bradyrhizobium sp. TaxID=376 RepID=UPI001D277EE4|nr:aminoacyl-tRNA deacylase [Bradyrhizobium sp.]MBI5320810.1 aminoacyl-tRNA deacylase [Bradyrhizobium sp.]